MALNILIVTNSYSRVQLVNFARILSKNHKVSVISFEKSADIRSRGKAQAYAYCEEVHWEDDGTLFNVLKSVLTLTPFCVIRNRSKGLARAIERFVHDNDVDIVVFEQLTMGQYHTRVDNCVKAFYPLDAFSRQKSQWYEVEKSLVKRIIYYVDYLMIRNYERHIYKEFDHLLLTSEEDAVYTRQTVKDLKARIHLVSNGVDLDYFHPESIDNDIQNPSLVFIGNMFNIVNRLSVQWFYEEVWSGLKSEIPQLTWYIIGDDPADLVKKQFKDDNIIFTGCIPDFRPYVWKASVSISPLTLGTGIKNKVLQAMAMGSPLVTTAISLEGISAEHMKHLIIANDAKDFKDGVVYLLKNNAEARRLASEARKLMEQEYSQEKVAEGFLNILTSIKLQEDARCKGPGVSRNEVSS